MNETGILREIQIVNYMISDTEFALREANERVLYFTRIVEELKAHRYNLEVKSLEPVVEVTL